MEVVYAYSHLGGEEILLVRHPDYYEEISDVILEVGAPGRNKISKEKTMKGRKLYSPGEINKLYKTAFNKRGWEELRDSYTIQIPSYPHTIPGAYKQCDFFKEPVLIEVQFGKYAFMFYDLAKFQYFYNKGDITLGVEIVPCHFLQKEMSSGVSYGEQLVYDLERLSKHFPSVPVLILLVDMPIGKDEYSIDGRREIRMALDSRRTETLRRVKKILEK